MRLVLSIVLAMFAGHALAQDRCPKEYEACMTNCFGRGSNDRCIEDCQSRNSACYARSVGGRSDMRAGTHAPQDVKLPPSPARPQGR